MTPSTSLSTSPSPLIGLIRAQVLLEAQRLCLEALASPMRRGLAAIGSKTLRDVWRGAVAGGAPLSPEQEADEQEARARGAGPPAPCDPPRSATPRGMSSLVGTARRT